MSSGSSVVGGARKTAGYHKLSDAHESQLVMACRAAAAGVLDLLDQSLVGDSILELLEAEVRATY